MLPPFIIDQIREREERERRNHAPQPTMELPVFDVPQRERDEHEDSERGVTIIDVMGEEG